jgi:hypothetical protein
MKVNCHIQAPAALPPGKYPCQFTLSMVVKCHALSFDPSKAIPSQTLGPQDVQAPEFLDSRHMKVARLSALRTGRLYPQKMSLILSS